MAFLSQVARRGDHDLRDLKTDRQNSPHFWRKAIRFSFLAGTAAIIMAPSLLTAETIHVFLLGGQSNADGRATFSGLSSTLLNPQADVPFYYAIDTSSNVGVPTTGGKLTTLRPGASRSSSNFGPEVTFGRSMADFYAQAGEKVALIKFAGGNTSLHTQWAPNGSASSSTDGYVYQNFQTIVGNGLAALQATNPSATLTINGMIWMQGEADANATNSGAYQTNLTNFISDIRLTYGANLPFVIGALSLNQTGASSYPNIQVVRAAQMAVDAADPFTKLVNTDNFGMNADKLHFNNAGQQALGYGFATQMQTLVSVPEPSTSALIFGALCLAASRSRAVRRAAKSLRGR